MAAFTSNANGNWNDGTTWGSANSPGNKGVDWPGASGDTFTIQAAHTVTYNVNEANQLGNSVCNGTLTFVTNANTKLCFGNNTFTFTANNSCLIMGNAATPVNSSYTADLLFFVAANSSRGINFAATANYTCYMYGDSNYYGGQAVTYLANDSDNTDGDANIVTVDDMSAKWRAGQIITLKHVKQWANNTTDWGEYTIQSISGTTITMTNNVTAVTAGVGVNWVAPVINLSRNVRIGDGNSFTSPPVYPASITNRVIFQANGTMASPSDKLFIDHTEFRGLYGINSTSGGTSGVVGNSVFRNSYFPMVSWTRGNISNTVFYAGTMAASSCVFTELANCYCIGITGPATYRGNVTNLYLSHAQCLAAGHGTDIVGAQYDGCPNLINYVPFDAKFTDGYLYGFRYINSSAAPEMVFENCEFGWDPSNNSLPSTTYDFNWNNYFMILLKNCREPLAGFSHANRTGYIRMSGWITCEDYNRVVGAQRIIQMHGDVTKVTAGTGTPVPDQRASGSTTLIELSNIQANLANWTGPLKAWVKNPMNVYLESGANKTITFYCQHDFTSNLTANDVRLWAKYYDDANSAHLATITSTNELAPRSNVADWSQSLALTINPGQNGFAELHIDFYKYESGKRFYIDPKFVVS